MPSCRLSWSGRPPIRSPALPELRAATAADTPALLEVFFRATEDLEQRRRRSIAPRNPAPLEELLRHLMTTDPATSLVADEGGRVAAFAMSTVREADWFLSFLFVAPEWQSRGLGRALVDACLAEAGQVDRKATCAEADQPVATALYASRGMVPLLPIYVLRGSLQGEALPELPAGLRARAFETARVAALDAWVLGYSRPQDHELWQNGRRGWLFEDDAGDVAGYGYAQPSGRVGPIAARDAADLLAFVGHLVRSTRVLEGWQLVVPGTAASVLPGLLAAGLRIDGTPAVYCADGQTPRFTHYIPGSFALL